MKEDVVKELSKKYNKDENLIGLMLIEIIKFGYNINDFEQILIGFYSKK